MNECFQKKFWRLQDARKYCAERGLPDPLARFHANRIQAGKRGIEWKLSFDDWWTIWEPHYHLRGHGHGKMNLCRSGDQGAYEVGNVRIDTFQANMKEMGEILRAAAAGRKATVRPVINPDAEHPGYIKHLFPLPIEFMDPMEIMILKQEFEATMREIFQQELAEMETTEIVRRWRARTATATH